MADSILLELDTRAFLASLRLTSEQVDSAMAKALRRTGFEIRDAENARIRGLFHFAGASTREFLAGPRSWRFEHATPDRLEQTIFASPGTGRILAPHVRGDEIAGGDKGRLTIEGQLATPVSVKRTARGRVRGAGKARRFVAGRAVLERVGRGARSIVRVAFALTPRAKLDDRFDFLATARRVASEQFAKKARQEFQRGVGLRRS